MTTRIAVWSGPRNISTAMMRAWGSRQDTVVVDEPLYARYLASDPSFDHPGRREILGTCETDLNAITAALTGPLPSAKTVHYQKHMAHHLLPGDLGDDALPGWIASLTNCFLIRDPAEMITSFIKVIPDPTPEQLGLPQQVRLLELVRKHSGRVPPVIDSKDVLENPEAMLRALCGATRVEFDPAMLAWAPGPRDTDGVWGPHWYDSVYRSTGFAPYQAKDDRVPDHLSGVLDECRRMYDTLARHRLQP